MITAVFQAIIILGFLLYQVIVGIGNLGSMLGNPVALLIFLGLLVGLMATFRSSEGGPAKTSGASQVPPQTSGFLSSTSIRTLLLTGSALFLFSVYLFVRSYWNLIIDEAKFGLLAVGTLALYASGFALYRRRIIPKTAQTLLALGLALLPACVYAANKMLLNGALSADATFCLGSTLMLLASIATSFILPTMGMGFLVEGSLAGVLYFGAGLVQPDLQLQLLTLPISGLCGIILIVAWQRKEDLVKGVALMIALLSLIDIAQAWSHGFFFGQGTMIYSAVNFLLCGILMVLLSRMVSSKLAYLANIFFLLSGFLFLRNFEIPIYKYGYLLIPAGFIALLRAWTFERDGKKSLARPYFVFGQFMLAASVLAVCPIFTGGHDVSFSSLMIVLVGASAAYATTGGMYRHAFYTYMSALVALFLAGTSTWQFNLDFSAALLFFTSVAMAFLLIGAAGEKVSDDLVGKPLSILGMITLSFCVAMSAGRWGNSYLLDGTLPRLPVEQLRAGLWTGGLSTLAYLFMAFRKKNRGLIYMALMSGTWVYVCWLQWMNFPVDLVRMSWLAAICMLIHYVLFAAGKKTESRCFSLWTMMLALFILFGAAASQAPTAFGAVLFCTLSFLPAIMTGETELVTAALLGAYASHLVWFLDWHRTTGSMNWAEYGLQLVALNLGVLFFRALITRGWPRTSYRPFQIVSIAFWTISLLTSLSDFNIAWQVFLIHAAMVLGVSMLHYDGKLNLLALGLAVASMEIFLFSRHVVYVEAYVAPFAIASFIFGYYQREHRSARDFLYGLGLILLYLPSSIYSMNETWEWHGIFLGVASLIVMLVGIQMRGKVLTVPSAIVLVLNGFIQSRQIFLVVPRWSYLGLGGLMLISLAGLFEFQRDALLKMKKQVEVSFKDWD